MQENLSRIVRTTTRGHVITDVWAEPILEKDTSTVDWRFSVHLGSTRVDDLRRFPIEDLPTVIHTLIEALNAMSKDEVAKKGKVLLHTFSEIWKPC